MIYRGYRIRIGRPRKDLKLVEIWNKEGTEMIDRTISMTHAEKIIDAWMEAR